MKRNILSLLLIITVVTLSSFRTVNDGKNNNAPAKIATPTVTEIGHQADEKYYYTFYADLTKESPNPITYIQVQRSTNGEVLKLTNFSGNVLYWKFTQFTINEKVTVSFHDGDAVVTKSLTGVIEGGVKP